MWLGTWGARMKDIDGEYPRPTGHVLCQCGGELITETTTHGHMADEHDVYRVRCRWCPMSTRWMCTEYDCLQELYGGMECRRTPDVPKDKQGRRR